MNRLKSTEKVIELKSYNKIAGYNIRIQKEINFLHTSNEQVEFEMKNVIPLIYMLQKNEIMNANPIKYV